ncbi:MAG: creatininase family protein [Thermodesulfobacteriota bacterium]
MILEEMTMKEFKRGMRKTRTLAVPYGTVEAHGEHLPLNTDTLVIREVLKKVSEETPLFVAPPVYYGVCTSTGRHPGTIGVTPATLRMLTKDIVRDASGKGFKRFILISGHGGSLHVSAMKEAAEALTVELKGAVIAALSIYEVLGPEANLIAETENDSHAGEMETSAVLYLAPELVKGRSKEEYPGLPKPIVARDKMKYWPGAVWGDPSKATAEKGLRLFDLMVRKVTGLVKKIERF